LERKKELNKLKSKRSAVPIPEDKRRKAKPAKRWGHAPTAWIELFNEIAEGLGEPRKMFGYPCAFVNGNMYAGLFETGLFLRLPESERAALLKLKGAVPFEPLPGRVMREYVVAPADLVQQPAVAAKWIRKAFDYGSSLPAKVKKRKPGPAR
jgi:TfoX/Sxy family transcriptional regulator of competence genes